MAQEQNLLLGVLAVQLKLVTSQQLVNAGAVWAANQERELGPILVELGALTSEQEAAIKGLIQVQLDAHSGDETAALQTMGGGLAVQESFAASLVYDVQEGVKYKSIGGEMPKPVDADEKQLLSDEGQLTTEHPGRYTIKGERGRGGVGLVMIAFDEHVGREIALKELLPEPVSVQATPIADGPMSKTATVTARFLREARITGQLEHPGIVPVYEVGQRIDGTAYYTMKLVRGDTLAVRLQRCKGIGDRLQLLPHYLDLCQAIAYAHSRGVIHRDIKPGNVMIGEFGETVLLDWGLAKVKGQKDEGAAKIADEIRLLKEASALETVVGSPIGTPSYMSPEQADGRIEDIDERSDVWSLGAVLYEILTGEPPFTGSTAYEVIGKVLSEPVKPVTLAGSPKTTSTPITSRAWFASAETESIGALGELSAVAEKCLQKKRGKRYATVQAMAGDIAAFQTGGLVSAYKYSAGKILARWAVRYSAVLVTAAIALLILAAVSWSAWVSVNKALTTVIGQNEELTRRGYELLSSGIVAKAINLRQQHGKWQAATLLVLQAAEYEERELGKLSNTTADAVRTQLGQITMGSDVLHGHDGRIFSICFSPDGMQLASAGEDNTVRLWQALYPLKDPRILAGHLDNIWSVAFSPDGKLLATASEDKTVRVWQVADLAAEPLVLTGHGKGVYQVCFSRDGELLASASYDEKLRIWRTSDLTMDPLVFQGHGGGMRRLAFSPDGNLLASGCEDRTLLVWQVANPDNPWVLAGHTNDISHICFSPDGKLLASVGMDKTVRVWQVSDLSAKPRVLTGHEDSIEKVVFSPDGRLLASAGRDSTLLIWQIADLSAKPYVLAEHSNPILDVAFSPDGSQIASASEDQTVRIWRVDDFSAKPQVLQGHDGRVWCIAFNPSGTQLASGAWDNTVRIWHIDEIKTEPRVLYGHEGRVKEVAFSQDGRFLISAGADGTVRVWNAADLTAEPAVLAGHDRGILCMVSSPDGKLLTTAGYDKTLRVWQLANVTAAPQVLRGHDDLIWYVSFSPDGKLMASASADGTVRVWQASNLAAEPLVLRDHSDEVVQVSFSPNGKWLATASKDMALRIWRTDDLSGKPQVIPGQQGLVCGFDFAPDGDQLVSLVSSTESSTMRIWQADDLTAEPEVLEEHKGLVTHLAISPDGKLMATASWDCTVRVWRLDDFRAEPVVLQGPEDPAVFVAFSPDGELLASASEDSKVRIWQVADLSRDPQVLHGHRSGATRLSFSPDSELIASASRDGTIRVWTTSFEDIQSQLVDECYRNLSGHEWQTYVGDAVPYEKAIGELPPGKGVALEPAIANQEH